MNGPLDITDTLAPKSDQLDAVDLLGGERTFVIDRATVTVAEQPVNLYLKDFPRPWRPGKNMRRVLAALWGPDAAKYIGRSVTLFCDTGVMFGGKEVGGTRIKALSDIGDKPRKVPILVSQGRTEVYVVQPITDGTDKAPKEPKQSPADVLVALYLAEYKVTKQQLEAHVALPFDAWTPETLNALRSLGGEINRGEKSITDVFGGDE